MDGRKKLSQLSTIKILNKNLIEIFTFFYWGWVSRILFLIFWVTKSYTNSFEITLSDMYCDETKRVLTHFNHQYEYAARCFCLYNSGVWFSPTYVERYIIITQLLIISACFTCSDYVSIVLKWNKILIGAVLSYWPIEIQVYYLYNFHNYSYNCLSKIIIVPQTK